MKIHVLSDLHIEHAPFDPPPTTADAVVLAGDIGVGTEGVIWAGKHFPDRPVVYVPGNHEFYGHDLELRADLKKAAADNVHVLNDEQLTIGGIRFVCSVLWTDFNLFGEGERFLSMRYANKAMQDFSAIRNGGRQFTPEDSVALHEASRDWLGNVLAEPFDGKTVVVTHHAPSTKSIAARYISDLLSPGFASKLEGLIKDHQPVLWVHGHTHDPFDYRIGSTRVVCNPRGYPRETRPKGFSPDLLVEV